MRNSPSELKSIEKMVNGLDADKQNNGAHDERDSPKIDLIDQWHDEQPFSTQFLSEADTVLNARHSSTDIVDIGEPMEVTHSTAALLA